VNTIKKPAKIQKSLKTGPGEEETDSEREEEGGKMKASEKREASSEKANLEEEKIEKRNPGLKDIIAITRDPMEEDITMNFNSFSFPFPFPFPFPFFFFGSFMSLFANK